MSLVLALDAGTTSVRAAVVDGAGRLSGLNAIALKTRRPAAGFAEQDAEAVWRAARATLRRALARVRVEPADLLGLGLTTQRASAVVWDKATGRTVTPLVLWSDLRGAGAADDLRRAGHFVAPQQTAAKLPLLLAQTGRDPAGLAWGGLDAFLLHRLTGGRLHGSDASQMWPSGYLALPDLGLNTALIGRQAFGDVAFPLLIDTWGPLGLVDPRVFGSRTPITASVADQAAALIAHGEAPGAAKFSWGTSGTFDLATEGLDLSRLPALPPLVTSAVGGHASHCIEGMILSAGGAVDWLRGIIRAGGVHAFERLAARAGTSGGVAFLPALDGLGAPAGDSAAKGVLAGLTAAADRGSVAMAGFEGLAFRARQILERAGLEEETVVGADGGLSRSRVFMQRLADLTRRPVRPLASPEATLLGAALLARRGAGLGGEAGFRAGYAPRETFEARVSRDDAAARFEAWKTAVGLGR